MWLETILALLVITLYQFSKNVQGLKCFLPLGGFSVRINSEKRLRKHAAFAPWANRRRRGCRKKRNVCAGRSCQGIAPKLPFVSEHFGVTRCNMRRPMPGDKDSEGPAPSAPTVHPAATPIPPIGSKPLNAQAKVFHPRSSSPSPTPSSASSPSQSSSPIPSLTSTTVSPLLSTAGKVFNISDQNLCYRSMSSLAASPPPLSPTGYGKGFGKIWSDNDRMVQLDRLANRMVWSQLDNDTNRMIENDLCSWHGYWLCVLYNY